MTQMKYHINVGLNVRINRYEKKIGGFKPPSGNWVMGLGSEAYVEEPKKLRDRVKADMKKVLVQYGFHLIYASLLWFVRMWYFYFVHQNTYRSIGNKKPFYVSGWIRS